MQDNRLRSQAPRKFVPASFDRRSSSPKAAGASGDHGASSVPQREGIRIGDQVRVIRDPLFGKLGEVASLPSDLQKIPTESEVRVMEVRFADGSRAMIPRANIELIEGA